MMYLIRVTEKTPREAVIEAETEKEAIELAEALWDDNYDHFKDIQDNDHDTSCLGVATEEDAKYLPDLSAKTLTE